MLFLTGRFLVKDIKQRVRKASAAADAAKRQLAALESLDQCEVATREAEEVVSRGLDNAFRFALRFPKLTICLNDKYVSIPPQMVLDLLALLGRACQCHVDDATREVQSVEVWDGAPETCPVGFGPFGR
jgi:hypothetical protein